MSETASEAQDSMLLVSLAMCLRAQWEPTAHAAFAAMAAAPGFDWDTWLRLARQERLCPLLHVVLRTGGTVPPHVEAELTRAYLANLQRNTVLLGELRQVLDKCAVLNSPPVLLKGAALALHLYDDIAMRPMSDLDLLVKESDFVPAARILKEMGYEDRPPSEPSPKGPVRVSQIALYKNQAPSIAVELHQSLLNYPYDTPAALPLGWFWATAEQKHANGAPCLVLGVDAHLLYLVSHVFIHHWAEQKLLWLHDIALLIRRNASRIHWDEIISRAVSADLIIPLQAVLPRLVELLGAPIPAGTLDTISRIVPSTNARRFFLLYAREPSSHSRVGALYFYVNLRNLPGWRAKCRFLRESLFPPPERLRLRYGIRHPALLPFAYAYRLLRGALSALRTTWDIALRKGWRGAGTTAGGFAPPGVISITATDFGLLAADILRSGASLRCQVRGSSMRPFVRDGDILTVAPAGCSPSVGDIVLYRAAGGNALLHRVIARREQDGTIRLTMWGDSAAGPVDDIAADGILGVAVALERAGRSIPLDHGFRRQATRVWTAVLRRRAASRPRHVH